MSRLVLASALRGGDYQFRSRLTSLAIAKGDGRDYCQWYWWGSIQYRIERLCGKKSWEDQREIFWRLSRLYKRHRQFCHYVQEVLPEWQDTGEIIAWADNSADKVQRDKDGNTRRVQIEAPHGDRCF